MGQNISANRLESVHNVNGFDLKINIDGSVQRKITGKYLRTSIRGFLYTQGNSVSNLATQVKTDFTNFIKSNQFKDYIEGSLFSKNVDFPPDFPYFVSKEAIEKLSWNMATVPQVSFTQDATQPNVDLKIDFNIASSDMPVVYFREVVILVGAGLVAALNVKLTEEMPIQDTEGNVYSFGPEEINFSIAPSL